MFTLRYLFFSGYTLSAILALSLVPISLLSGNNNFIPYIENDLITDGNRLIFVVGFPIVYLVSLGISLRLLSVPTIDSFSKILAINLIAYGFLGLILSFSRVPLLSRTVIVVEFILSSLLLLLFVFIKNQVFRKKFGILPGVPPAAFISFSEIEWTVLDDDFSDVSSLDGVVTNLSVSESELPRNLDVFSSNRIPIHASGHLLESLSGRVHLADLTATELESFSSPSIYTNVKQLVEIVLIILSLPLSVPLAVLISSIIRITSSGPAFFTQPRVGMHGEQFNIIKFRSMYVNSEDMASRFADQNDQRITNFGRLIRRFHLDELPQLFNVLKGDMSVIGPRPEQPDFVIRYNEIIPYYGFRHSIRPGLTGWAQVMHGYAASDKENKKKLEFDFFYIKHMSPWLDLIIIIRTIRAVIFGTRKIIGLISLNKYSIDRYLKLNSFSIFSCFALVAVLACLTFGINVGDYETYNLFYFEIFTNPEKYFNTPLVILLTSFPPKLFTLILQPILLEPRLMLAAAIACNSFSLFLAYKCIGKFLNPLDAFILTLVIGLVISSPITGFPNTELVFTRKAATTLLLISGFLAFLELRIILGSTLFGAAVLLHPLDATSTLFFVVPGFTIYHFYRGQLFRTSSLLKLTPLFLAFVYNFLALNSFTTATWETSLFEWYKFSTNMEPDDVTMYWKLYATSSHALPLLTLSSFVAFQARKKDALDYINLCFSPLLALILLVEILQHQGIFVPRLSEIFSTLQLRRGIWIISLLSIVIVYRYLNQKRKLGDTNTIAAFFLLSILFNSPLVSILFICYLISIFRIHIFSLIAIVASLPILWHLTQTTSGLGFTNSIDKVSLFLFLCIVYYYFRRLKSKYISCILVISIYSAVVLVHNNLRYNIFDESYDSLISIFELHTDRYLNLKADGQTERFSLEQDVLLVLNRQSGASDTNVLFSPLALGYYARRYCRYGLCFFRDGITL